MIEFKPRPSFEREERKVKNGEDPCVFCGRGTARDWRHAIHLHNGGGHVVQVGEEEAIGIRESADLGWHPIGPDCAKRAELRAYVYEWHGGNPEPAFPKEHAAEAARIVAEVEAVRAAVLFPVEGGK